MLDEMEAQLKLFVIRTFKQLKTNISIMRTRSDQRGYSSCEIRYFFASSLGKFKKLSPRYCGPYEIANGISDQAYKLRLPPNLNVHNVFHVSLLKPYVPNPDQLLDVEQIVVFAQGNLELQLDYILEMRERKLRNRSIIEHLVKWKDFPEEDATWEDEVTLQKDYPDLHLR
ncbi:hypothetical protein L7F22_062494 [Adiantum nelumboides]|nr:hypothetical protein [Adiantum nelumboides]